MDSPRPHPDVRRTPKRHMVLGMMVFAVSCTGQRAEPPPPAPPPPPPVAAVQDTVTLPGLCEPSAAVESPFGDIWVVDDDQDDTLYLLTPGELAPRPIPAPRVPDKDKDKDKAAVKDLEGVTFDKKGRLWLMGSHSRSRSGKLGRRARLASMDPSAPGGPAVGTGSLWPDDDKAVPESLVEQLKVHCPACVPGVDWSTLNFEGLTAEPGTQALLLGARAPLLSDGNAWLVAVRPDGEFPVKRVHTVDLGKRGVRDLAPAPDGGGVWILAGPPQDKDEHAVGFALYSWQPGRPARQLARLPEVAGSPEGLWPQDDRSAWLFVDEGDRLKAAALADEGAPHRKVKKDGEVKFSCGAAIPEGGTQSWAHAVRVSWTAVDATDPPPR